MGGNPETWSDPTGHYIPCPDGGCGGGGSGGSGSGSGGNGGGSGYGGGNGSHIYYVNDPPEKGGFGPGVTGMPPDESASTTGDGGDTTTASDHPQEPPDTVANDVPDIFGDDVSTNEQLAEQKVYEYHLEQASAMAKDAESAAKEGSSDTSSLLLFFLR